MLISDPPQLLVGPVHDRIRQAHMADTRAAGACRDVREERLEVLGDDGDRRLATS
jgi:hypothetical protein